MGHVIVRQRRTSKGFASPPCCSLAGSLRRPFGALLHRSLAGFTRFRPIGHAVGPASRDRRRPDGVALSQVPACPTTGSPLTRQVKEASDIVAVVGSYLSLSPGRQHLQGHLPVPQRHPTVPAGRPQVAELPLLVVRQEGRRLHLRLRVREGLASARPAKSSPAGPESTWKGRRSKTFAAGKLLDAMKWAEGVYQKCLLETPTRANGPGCTSASES